MKSWENKVKIFRPEWVNSILCSCLSEKIGTPAHEHIKKQHHHWYCLRKLAYFTLCGVFLLIGVGMACNYNQQCSLYASQTMADISYPLIRIIRFVALPIHKFHDMSFMNKWDCIIDNPLYVPGTVNSFREISVSLTCETL